MSRSNRVCYTGTYGVEISALIRMESLLYLTQHVIVSSLSSYFNAFAITKIMLGYEKISDIEMNPSEVEVENDIVDLWRRWIKVEMLLPLIQLGFCYIFIQRTSPGEVWSFSNLSLKEVVYLSKCLVSKATFFRWTQWSRIWNVMVCWLWRFLLWCLFSGTIVFQVNRFLIPLYLSIVWMWEENEEFFIKVWKPLPNIHVLNPWDKVQGGQYLLTVGLSYYKWYQS